MKLAYLLNQYPMPSQTFIRREISALEAHGVAVARFTIRRTDGSIVDPSDQAEVDRTRAVLDVGGNGLAVALVRCALRRPLRFARAFGLAVRLGRGSARGLPLHLVYLAEACVLLGWFRRDQITHVHSHFGTNAPMVALLVARLGGPSYSFTIHGPEEFDHPEGLHLREKVAHAAFVVAISEFCRSQVYRWTAPEHWPKVEIVHCGLDATFLDGPLTPTPELRRLVSVGRLCEQKGQLLLIEAALRLAEEIDFELVLVGDGPLRGAIESRLAEGDRSGVVRLAGTLDNEAVRQEMLDARATVLPSFAEGLPVVLMESLALGRPVISTFVAGIPELVSDGACGWLVPAGSVDALVVAMREALLAPTARLDELGREGAARVRSRHDAATEARRLSELLTSYSDSGT